MGRANAGPLGGAVRGAVAGAGSVVEADEITVSVYRGDEGTYATIGAMTVSCEGVFEPFTCVTLELRRGSYDLGIKKGRKTYPIPAGTYVGRHTRERFNNFMIEVDDVPGFEGIQFHVGTYPWNTHGCILVGSKVNLKTVVTKDKMNPLTAPVKQTAEERWNISVEAGLLLAPKGSRSGTTDTISGSGTAMRAIAKLHTKAEKKFGKGKVRYKIVIQEGSPPIVPFQVPFADEIQGMLQIGRSVRGVLGWW